MKRLSLLVVGLFALITAFTSAQSPGDGAASGNAAPSATTYKVGDTGPAGGIIFYDKGNNSDGWEYLEAAPTDQGSGIVWYNNGKFSAIKTDTIVGSGRTNTANIVSVQGPGNYAAAICKNLTLGGYSDWFLPSLDEINLMNTNLFKTGLGGIAGDNYWTSSQKPNGYFTVTAYFRLFGEGTGDAKEDIPCRVRAIRAF